MRSAPSQREIEGRSIDRILKSDFEFNEKAGGPESLTRASFFVAVAYFMLRKAVAFKIATRNEIQAGRNDKPRDINHRGNNCRADSHTDS